MVTHPLVNLIGFQICWWSCALLPQPVSLTVITLFVSLHLSLHPQRNHEMRAIASAASIGIGMDTVLTLLGVLQFDSTPFWLLGLWIALATTLNQSLKFFQNHLLLAGLLGAIGGPANYFAGQQLGVLQLGDPLWLSLLIMSIFWGMVFPALLCVANPEKCPLFKKSVLLTRTGG